MDASKHTKQKAMDSDLSKRSEFASVLKHFKLFRPESKYKVVCPFHADVNASMLIDLDSAKFYCFGCLKAGGSYDFVKYSYPDKKPMELLNLMQEIKKGKESNLDKIVRLKPIKRNINAVRDYYFNLKSINWHSVKDEGGVKKYLRKRGFTSSVLNAVHAKINENTNYPIIFPIMDNKVFRGYVCRTMDKEIEAKRKYLYNSGFRRANTLAGNYGKTDTVLIVEGFMDMVKAQQMGISQVVAILGWKASDNQIKKLKRKGIKHIICGLDADKSGRRGYEYLKQLNEFKVSKLVYPKGIKDFGDVTKRVFNERIKNQIIRLCESKLF